MLELVRLLTVGQERGYPYTSHWPVTHPWSHERSAGGFYIAVERKQSVSRQILTFDSLHVCHREGSRMTSAEAL